MKKHSLKTFALCFTFFLFITSHLIAAETVAAPQTQPAPAARVSEGSSEPPIVKHKFAYFDMNYQSNIIDYQFLSSSLTRSMRGVLSNQGFITVDSQGKQIADVYDRQKILATGKELQTDLILCGRYYVVGEGVNAKIHLIIVVYDVNGGERVIQKLVIGGTGTGMFVLVDESAGIIKEAVAAYFKRRQEILEEAKRQREEMERLAEAERRRKQEEELNSSLVKTRYNNSMYLDSHVARAKQFKLFYFLAVEKNDLQIGDDTIQDGSANLPTNLALSLGLGKELELKLDLAFMLYKHYIEKKSGVENSLSSNMEVYNPILGIKWRFLQNENHGLNMSFYFGFQPGLSNSAYGGTIFHFVVLKSIHTIYANFSLDKTFGIFTPYINIENAIGIRYKGTYLINFIIPSGNDGERDIIDFGPNNKRIFYSFKLKIGTEVRFNSWFFINVGISYMYQSGFENSYNDNGSPESVTVSAVHVFTPDIKLIFEVKRNFALSLDFQYNFFLKDIQIGDFSSSSTQPLKFNTSFKVIFYAAWALDF